MDNQVDLIRSKFQTSKSRMEMFLLMLNEIKLEEMKKHKKDIPVFEIITILEDEFNDLKDNLLLQEKQKYFNSIMEDFNL